MHLTDLLNKLATPAADIATTKISGLTVNSAQVKEGDLFFALLGKTHDGRDFIDDAIKRGAVAIVTDTRPFAPKSYLFQLCKLKAHANLWRK